VTGLQTEFAFRLPKGFVDSAGTLHVDGLMRLATARDEIEPLRDPRIAGPDDPYLTIAILARVITRLGTITDVTPQHVEALFAADLGHLQDLYLATPPKLRPSKRKPRRGSLRTMRHVKQTAVAPPMVWMTMQAQLCRRHRNRRRSPPPQARGFGVESRRSQRGETSDHVSPGRSVGRIGVPGVSPPLGSRPAS
jgi:hypothetical protein